MVRCSMYPSIFISTDKENPMNANIDKIDVKTEHRELIALFYRLELQTVIMQLLYEHRSLYRLSTME